MATIEEKKADLEFHRAALKRLQETYLSIVDGGVQSYGVGSHSANKLDIKKINEEIEYHKKEISALESELSGRTRRRAMGFVVRDW